MSFFKPLVSFPLSFPAPFSAIRHNSSEIFKLKDYILWKKRAHQLLRALMKVNPTPLAIFKPQGQGLLKFCTTVQCRKR